MKTSTRWVSAVGFIGALMFIGCAGGLQNIKLPPISIVIPAPAEPTPAPVVEARATLAFVVTDAETGQVIEGALVTVSRENRKIDPPPLRTNNDGYVAFEAIVQGEYVAHVDVIGYAPKHLRVVLSDNTQVAVALDQLRDEAPPLQDLFIHIRGGGQPLITGHCTVDGERRNVENGDGVIHFPITEPVVAVCSAGGFLVKQFHFPPGHHNADLEPIAAPPLAPSPVPTPTPNPRPLCPPGGDPLTCVRSVAALFPQLLQINTFESCLEFTQRVLAALGPEYGHVAKTRGEAQSVPRGFVELDVCSDGTISTSGACPSGTKGPFHITGVSHDAIKHRDTGQVVDLISNASANSDPRPEIHGPAGVQWELVDPQHWRENNPFIPAVPVR